MPKYWIGKEGGLYIKTADTAETVQLPDALVELEVVEDVNVDMDSTSAEINNRESSYTKNRQATQSCEVSGTITYKEGTTSTGALQDLMDSYTNNEVVTIAVLTAKHDATAPSGTIATKGVLGNFEVTELVHNQPLTDGQTIDFTAMLYHWEDDDQEANYKWYEVEGTEQ